ncbi:MAG: LicD family protein, partial [Synergistaceae bacterium]|nr:LicD family protein [Synergistaceae bacterium]
MCDKHNLRYWIAGGSLIGVIRHQGFIPWDDDLDVFMPRPDYEKMWSLLGGAMIDGHFVLCRTNRGKNYHHRVMQLVDTETTFIHSRCRDEDIEHGVYIDIIPLDG